MQRIKKYFPEVSPTQMEQFILMEKSYRDWNEKINVVSRKDIDELVERHILHSLAIAKVLSFKPGTRVLDVGTGGGFPGVPLAVLFPKVEFHLVDSIAKKIKVVNEVVDGLGLKNVLAEQKRAEKIKGEYDFIVSRAVTQMSRFMLWTKGKVKKESKHELSNGILYLKGGDLSEELSSYPSVKLYPIKNFFEADFFETKKVVYLPVE